MKADPTNFLEIAGIKTPLIGFYDVPDPKPFKPFAKPNRCVFSCYENWLKGESTCITANDFSCRGGGYWIGGVEFTTRDNFEKFLGATDIAMRQHLPPDILTLTVNKPMYRQLCELDKNSFLYKSFWKTLRKARNIPCEPP